MSSDTPTRGALELSIILTLFNPHGPPSPSQLQLLALISATYSSSPAGFSMAQWSSLLLLSSVFQRLAQLATQETVSIAEPRPCLDTPHLDSVWPRSLSLTYLPTSNLGPMGRTAIHKKQEPCPDSIQTTTQRQHRHKTCP